MNACICCGSALERHDWETAPRYERRRYCGMACAKHYAHWGGHVRPARESLPPRPEACTAAGCEKPNAWGGLCSMHQARKARHGSVDGISPKRVGSPGDSLMRRLLLGVDDDSDCWLWGRAKSDSGYGHLLHLGRQRGVHVWMWEAYHGRPVPPGMQVCHSCDVRACLNPNHLWLGSAADNAADMREKRRQARGSRHSQALLTEEQVLAIRADHRNRREVAADYGISPHTVYCIRTRLSWQWLGDDGEAIA